jgi:phenylpyruvate tautomerase PptA (4-oxalocrotonate tautomerase family)
VLYLITNLSYIKYRFTGGGKMPIIEAHILEGYDPAQKTRLCEALTDAVRFVVPAAPDAITVMLHEMGPDTYMRGGQTRKPAAARLDPKKLVTDFLQAMTDRDLEKAETYLARDFRMVFPGTPPMTCLSQLVNWAAGRYRFVKKTIDRIEAFQAQETIVYTSGTLSGEWPDGSPFEGIRFIDRFELADNKITLQEVWNDIAEVRP